MLGWIAANADVLGLLISFCTLLIWAVYAQLLYAGFRRQRQPSLMLNRGHGRGLDALCVVGNMSAEGIFVQYVTAELETARGTIHMDITDRRTLADGGDSGNDGGDGDGGGGSGEGRSGGSDGGDERDGTGGFSSEPRTASVLSELTYQGPLQSNGTFHIGSFAHLLERLLTHDGRGESFAPRGGKDAADEWTLTVRLIASYGPESKPVGAERTFRITSGEAGATVVPNAWHTRQLSSRAERRELERQVREIHDAESSAVAAGEEVTGRDVVRATRAREASDESNDAAP